MFILLNYDNLGFAFMQTILIPFCDRKTVLNCQVLHFHVIKYENFIKWKIKRSKQADSLQILWYPTTQKLFSVLDIVLILFGKQQILGNFENIVA
jgi:hypothetical protein